MRFSDLTPADIAPSFIPVATVDFRGKQIDIYPLDAANLMTLVARKPAILNVWFADADSKAKALVEAIMSLDAETIEWAVSIALDAPMEQIRAFKPAMNAGEQIRILITMVQASIPESEKEKIKAGVVSVLTTTLGLAKLAEQEQTGPASSSNSSGNTAPASGNSRRAPSSPATSSRKPTGRARS
ncbi:hypothetical protein [Tabrizicola soli]|uniref:Tail assembly chaperone n=1 Tax=Tabrizicola soli TaxID=2185115 RepID=A0ABV7E1N4_9RHOB|nr:hypothetical protein [Tabrizicola soli]